MIRRAEQAVSVFVSLIGSFCLQLVTVLKFVTISMPCVGRPTPTLDRTNMPAPEKAARLSGLYIAHLSVKYLETLVAGRVR